MPSGAVARPAIPGREAIVLRGRELFIHYPDGIGRSKTRFSLGPSSPFTIPAPMSFSAMSVRFGSRPPPHLHFAGRRNVLARRP
jgi:hypothetical protein